MRLLKKILKLSRSKLLFSGLINGIPANVELEPLIKKIKEPETIIDIGSNKGQFILLAENMYPEKKVYSFEPIIELINKQKKFFKFKKNIYYYNIALGSTVKSDNFLITKRIDIFSFLEIEKNKNNSDYYNVQEKRNIKINTLDNILYKKKLTYPILIKIDVQGFELEVLKGSQKILKATKYILLEVSKNEMYKKQPTEAKIIYFLKKNNFKIFISNKWSKIKNTNFKQRDILFIKKK